LGTQGDRDTGLARGLLGNACLNTGSLWRRSEMEEECDGGGVKMEMEMEPRGVISRWRVGMGVVGVLQQRPHTVFLCCTEYGVPP
jgi:hypothetical protein